MHYLFKNYGKPSLEGHIAKYQQSLSLGAKIMEIKISLFVLCFACMFLQGAQTFEMR